MDKSKILLILSVVILACSIIVAKYQSSTAYTNFTNLTSKLLNTNDTTLSEDYKPVEENVYYNPFGGEYGENSPYDSVLTNQGDLYYDPFGEGLQYVTEKPESIAGITPSTPQNNNAVNNETETAYTAEDDLNMINSMMNNNQVNLFNADTTEGQKDVYVKYLGEVAEGGSAYTSAKVEVRRDYLKGINVAVTAFTLADDYNFNDSTVDSNGTGLPTGFAVTAVYAGKTTAVNLTPKTDWTVTPIKAADGLADNQTITLTVSPVDGGKADGLEAVSFQVVVGKEIASASYGVAK